MSLLPAIKPQVKQAPPSTQPNSPPKRGEAKSLLNSHDLNAIKGYIAYNRKIPFQHRRGDLHSLIPSSPFRKSQEPSDSETGLRLAGLLPLESSIDIPVRFAAPSEYHAPPVVDQRPSAPPIQQLFAFMKGPMFLRPIHDHNSSVGGGGTSTAPTAGGGQASVRAGGPDGTPTLRGKESGGYRPLDPKDYMLRALTSRRSGQRKQEAIAYYCTACIAYSQTDFEKAIDMLSRCVSVMEKISDKRGLAAAHNLLGICYFKLQRYRTAVYHYKKQEVLCGAYGRAVAQVNLGVAYGALSETTFAVHSLMDALDNSRQTQDMCIESLALGNLGLALLRIGNLRGAQEKLEACMELCSLSGDETGASACLLLLGEVYALAKDNQRAQFYFSNALRVATEGGVKDVAHVARVSLGISRGNDQYVSYVGVAQCDVFAVLFFLCVRVAQTGWWCGVVPHTQCEHKRRKCSQLMLTQNPASQDPNSGEH